MIHNRTPEEVRRYDILKLVVLLILLVLIVFMLFRDSDTETLTTTADPAAISEVDEAAAEPDETSSEMPESVEDTQDAATELEEGSEAPEESTEESDTAVAEGAQDETGTETGEADTEIEDTETDSEASEDVDAEADSVAPQLLSPAPGAEVESDAVLFSGTGAPDSMIRVLADGSEAGQTQVDADGNWLWEGELEAGEPLIELQTLDAEGNVTASSEPVAIVVIEAEKTVATPDLVLNEMNLYAGSVALAGSGEPDQSINIIVDGEEIATAQVDEAGNWSLPLDLEAGSSSVSLQTVNENGEVINEAGPFEITVQDAILPTVDLPDADVFTGGMTLTGTGQPGAQVQLYANELVIGVAKVDAGGNYTIEVDLEAGRYDIDVAQLDSSGNPGDLVPALSLPVLPLPGPTTTFSDLDVPDFDPLSGLTSWQGTADPEGKVVLLDNGEVVGEATADADGNWAMVIDLEPGSYEITVASLDVDGNVIAESNPIMFDLTGEPPHFVLPEYSVVESESTDGERLQTAIQLTAGDFAWSGEGEPNGSIAVIVDGEVVGTTSVAEDGTWTITSNLEEGDHEVQLATLDSAGNLVSRSVSISVNVAAVTLPAIETLELEQDSGKGTISGTADPGTTVMVRANGRIAGIATTGEDGKWSANVDLGTGSFELQVQVLDEDGNVALSSEKKTVEVTGETAPAEVEDDVIDATAARGNFSTLITGLESAGLTARLSEVEDAYTLFAPTDEAFASLPEEVIAAWNDNPEAYKEIMFYLVLEGAYTQEELAAAQVLTTLAGTNVGITTGDTTVLINKVPVVESIPAGNSIVHAIEEVILPPLGYQAQPPIIDISGVSIFTGDYLTVVGKAEPGTTILLQVAGENFGELAAVDESGSWLVSDNISSGVQEITAYMLDESGILMAISQTVSLPVQ
ncbi:MAG: hypothetical protein GWP61_03740 [Chloroflexi bacterium]|jgi:uncharacterized surface protein with fasciclin (FAS1) repeats|nr:hypothetical protein [Chloroflexota bacterium]